MREQSRGSRAQEGSQEGTLRRHLSLQQRQTDKELRDAHAAAVASEERADAAIARAEEAERRAEEAQIESQLARDDASAEAKFVREAREALSASLYACKLVDRQLQRSRDKVERLQTDSVHLPKVTQDHGAMAGAGQEKRLHRKAARAALLGAHPEIAAVTSG